jgi:hypothetical protein
LIHAALDSIAAAMIGETIEGDIDSVRTDGSRFARVGAHFGDAYIKLNIERDDDDDDTYTASSLAGLKLRQVITGAVGAIRAAQAAGTLSVAGDYYRDHFDGERSLMASAPFEDETAWITITSPAQDFTPYSRALNLNRTPRQPITPAPEPVEVELDRSAPWKTNLDDLAEATPVETEAAVAEIESVEVVETAVTKAKGSKPKDIDFVVVKPAPKNKRSKIGEVRRATPEALAAINAKLVATALQRAA